MTYNEIKEAEQEYLKADNEWEEAKRKYWSEVKPCSNILCEYYNTCMTNHCTWYNIQEDCEKYIGISFEEEIDNFMYGTRNPEHFPDSVQVRDEHTGLNVLDWKLYMNHPKYRREFAKYFYEVALKAQKGEQDD
jgi:hypothetical protein